jgi:hypothetical protein
MQMVLGCSVRFEERAREFFHVARLTSKQGNRSESKSERAIVTWIRPEAR